MWFTCFLYAACFLRKFRPVKFIYLIYFHEKYFNCCPAIIFNFKFFWQFFIKSASFSTVENLETLSRVLLNGWCNHERSFSQSFNYSVRRASHQCMRERLRVFKRNCKFRATEWEMFILQREPISETKVKLNKIHWMEKWMIWVS